MATDRAEAHTEDKTMSDMKKLNDEALTNVTGGMAGIVDTGTDQNAVVRSGAGKGYEQIDESSIQEQIRMLW